MNVMASLSKGFEILSKYFKNNESIECDIDTIITNLKPEDLIDEDYDMLLDIGFEFDEDYDCIVYFL